MTGPEMLFRLATLNTAYAACIDADRVGDQVFLADHVIDEDVSKQHARARRFPDADIAVRRLWAGLRQERRELLLSRCHDHGREGIGLGKHRVLGRIETQIVGRHDRRHRQQRHQHDCGDG